MKKVKVISIAAMLMTPVVASACLDAVENCDPVCALEQYYAMERILKVYEQAVKDERAGVKDDIGAVRARVAMRVPGCAPDPGRVAHVKRVIDDK